VYFVRDYFGNAIAVNFLVRAGDSYENKVELISRISNAERVTKMIGNWGPGSYKFTSGDLRILQSMESSPRKPYNVIASEVGMTPRQVKWRLDKMMEARALFVVQIRNYRALSGE